MRHFKQRESFLNMNNGFSNEYRYSHKTSKTFSHWWKRMRARNGKEGW